MRNENVNVLKIRYLLAEFRETQNPTFATDICNLLLEGGVKITAPPAKDNKTLFIVASKYQSKCCRCEMPYSFGDPIFVRDRRAWHLNCCEVEDLENTYYKSCYERGLLDNFDPKTIILSSSKKRDDIVPVRSKTIMKRKGDKTNE